MFEEAITDLPVAISQDLAVFPPAVVPGQLLADRYEVGERIGGGGMADVFRARDRLLRRNVAVKVMRPHLASEEMRGRMLREARAAAALDHLHVLRVNDFGTLGASAYIVTELLTGRSLSELLKVLPEHRLGWRSALTLLLPALDALDGAHRLGMIHRDLKPDNLFVHRRDGRDVLIVLDLGIAKVAPARAGTGEPAATETGRVLGTPAYMSPEQASGLPVDHRTDIYSIGITLYRMLAGRMPLEPEPGDPPMALMARNIYDPPRPLDDETLALPPGLAEIVMQTLVKAPSGRPQSMRALAAALAVYLPGVRVAGPPPPPLERSGRLHRIARISTSFGLLIALIALSAPLAVGVDAVRASAAADAPPTTAAAAPSSADAEADAPPPTAAAATAVASAATTASAPHFAPSPDASPPPPSATETPPPITQRPNPAESGEALPTTAAKARRPDPPDPRAAARLLLLRREAQLQRCVDLYDPALHRLTLRVEIDAKGSPQAVSLDGRPQSPLTLCLADALANLSFAPGTPSPLTHTLPRRTHR